MSRIGLEAQRRLHSPGSRVSSQGEDHAGHARSAWAWRGGWDFWVVRVVLVAGAGGVGCTLGAFGLRGWRAAGVGFLLAVGGSFWGGWGLRGGVRWALCGGPLWGGW